MGGRIDDSGQWTGDRRVVEIKKRGYCITCCGAVAPVNKKVVTSCCKVHHLVFLQQL
jgi:hypothetical protein